MRSPPLFAWFAQRAQKIPLRLVLVVPFVLQIVLAVGLVGYLSWQNGQRAVDDLASRLTMEVSDRVYRYVDEYMSTAQKVNQMNLDAVETGVLDLHDFQSVGKYFWRQVRLFNLSYINFGSSAGEFVGAGQVLTPQTVISQITPNNPGVMYEYATNEQGNRLRINSMIKRPNLNAGAWYADPVKAGKPVWSAIYNWVGLPDQLAISASAPVYNQTQTLLGVLGIDLKLADLKHFLQELKIGKTGKVFLMERSGLVIASSGQEQTYRLVNGKAERLEAAQIHDPLIQKTTHSLVQQFGSFRKIDKTRQLTPVIQGKREFIQVTPYRDQYGLDWLIVVVVPESDFMGQIDHSAHLLLLLCLGALAGAIALGLLTARWITRPIQRLSRASCGLAEGYWDQALKENSPIAELAALAHSFNQTAEQLQRSFGQVRTALQESEEKFTKVFRVSPDAISVAALPEVRYLEVNDSYLETTGYSREQVIGRTAAELNLAVNLEQIQQFEHLIKTRQEIRNLEFNFRTQPGQIKTALLSSEVIELEGQTCLLSVFRDITDRKQLELALQASESKLNDVLNSAIAGICCFRLYADYSLQYQYFSAGHQLLFGYTQQELRENVVLWRSRVHPEDLENVLMPTYAALFSERAVSVEYRFRHKDGTLRWISDNLLSRWDEAAACWIVTAVATDITLHKQAQEKLRHSEALLREAQHVAHIGSWEYEPIAQAITWSEELCRIHGRDLQESCLSLDELNEMIHPGDRLAYQQLVEQSIAAGIAHRSDLRIVRPDGSIRSVEVRGKPIFDRQGQLLRVVGTTLDITNRKRIEEALRRSEEQLRQITDALPVYIAYLDANQHYQFVNKIYETRFGWSREQFYGKHIRTVLGEDNYREIQAYLENALAGHLTTYTIEQSGLQGSKHYLEVTLIPDFDDHFQVGGCYSLVIDITARKCAEEALIQSEQRFRGAFDSSAVGMNLTAPDGKFLQVNPAFCQMLGYSEPEMLILTFQAITYPDDLETDLGYVQQLLSGQISYYHLEKRYVRKDGEIIWVLLSVSAVRDRHQTPLYFLAHVQDITDRKQAEAQLKAQQTFLRQVIDVIPSAVFVRDREGRFLVANQTIAAIHGVTVEQMLGKREPDFNPRFDPALLEQYLSNNRQVIATGRAKQSSPHQFMTTTGELRWYQTLISPFIDASGKVQGVLGNSVDVTELKQVETILRQSETTKNQILKAIPDLIIWMTVDGICIDLIEGSSITSTIPRCKAIGRNLYEILPGKLAKQRIKLIQQALQTGEVQVSEQQLIVQGQQRDEEVRVVAVEDDKVLMIIRDITDRKQAEQALSASTERELAIARVVQRMRQSLDLNAIFDATTQEVRQLLKCDRVVIYRFNPDWSGEFVAESVAEGWLPLLRNSDPDLTKVTLNCESCMLEAWDGLDSGSDHSGSDRSIRDTYLQETQGGEYGQGNGQGKSYSAVQDIYRAKFNPCYVELLERFQAKAYINVAIFCGNKLWGLLASYQNSDARQWQEAEMRIVTQIGSQLGVAIQQAELFAQIRQQTGELQAAKEAADTANQAKSSFLANMSHELRTPLNAILGFTQLMTRNALTAQQREQLETINRNGEYLLQLINDVLSIAKIEAGRVTLEETSCDLYALLDTLEGMFRLRAELKGLQLICDRAATVPRYIQIDERKLRQSLINLLDNAIKFTRVGTVTLRVKADSEDTAKAQHCCLVFEIEDTGCGIAPEELPMLFNPFVQTESGRQSSQGTGLGLVISRRFVQLMGGEMTVSSQPAIGTLFRIEIMAQIAESSGRRLPSSDRQVIGLAPDQSHFRILVVDDVLENRRLLVNWLTAVGFEVQEADNGQAAIDLWKRHTPHLIWMDMRLPVMDGYEATRQIRAIERQTQASRGAMISHEAIDIESQTQLPTPTKIIAISASVFEEERQRILATGCDDFVGKPFSETIIFDTLTQHLGVRYTYGNSHENLLKSSPRHALSKEILLKETLIVEALMSMPIEWLQQLRFAAQIGDDQDALQLLKQIPESQSFLSEALSELVHDLRLDRVIDLTQR